MGAELRRFLNAHNISQSLAMRIHLGAQTVVMERKRHTPEDSVELLALVSEPLRVDLHFEVNAPALEVHPFFHYYTQVSVAAMRQVCHLAISTLTLHGGDLLFHSGEMPEQPFMFFITQGELIYFPDFGEEDDLEEG